jgi:hypothetical protein
MNTVTDDVRNHILSVQRRLARIETAARYSTPPRLSQQQQQQLYIQSTSSSAAAATDLKQVSPVASSLARHLASPHCDQRTHHSASPQPLLLDAEEEEVKWLLTDIERLRGRLAAAEGSLDTLRHQHRHVVLDEKSKLTARLRVVKKQREQHCLKTPFETSNVESAARSQ